MSARQEAPKAAPKAPAQPAPFRVNRFKAKNKSGGADGAAKDNPVGELVLFDDGSEAAGKAQSSAMRLAINYAEPDIAAGTAVFGLGLLGLPFLAHLNCLSLAAGSDLGHVEGDGVFAYDAHVKRNAKKLMASYFDKRDLQRRFGKLDVAFLAKEISDEQEEFDGRMSQAGEQAVGNEATQVQQWRSQVNSHVTLLQKRSACSFLGLPPEPAEAEVLKRYKKMAFELHPDKGGDHAKFKELQEMRDRLVEKRCDLEEEDAAGAEAGGSDSEESEAEDSDGERQTRRLKKKKKKKEEEEKRLADAGVFNWRNDLREGLLRLWESAGTSQAEIFASSCVTGSSQQALNILRELIDRFVSSEVDVKDQMTDAEAEAAFQKFIKQGVEIIPVAAVIDGDAAMSTLALHFNYRLLSRCCSAGIKARCSKLLEAAVAVPLLVKPFLQALWDVSASRQERKRQVREQLEAKAAAEFAAQAAPKRRRMCVDWEGKLQQSTNPDGTGGAAPDAAAAPAVAADSAAAGSSVPVQRKKWAVPIRPKAAAKAEASLGSQAPTPASGSSSKDGEKENIMETPRPTPKPSHRAGKKTSPAAVHMLARLRSPSSEPKAVPAKGRGKGGAATDRKAETGLPRSFAPAAPAAEDAGTKPLVEVQLQCVNTKPVFEEAVADADDAERERMLRRTERLLQRLDDRERRRQGKAKKHEAQKMETWARKWISRKRRTDSAE